MKEYQEYISEKMSRAYEMYRELEQFYEEDEEQNYKTASIQYIRAEDYDIYENNFEIKGFEIKVKDEIHSLDIMAYQWDFFCRLNIFYHAHSDEYITPKWLHDRKLISNGRYTAWKGFFMESIFSQFFDVERKPYKISGMKELLSNQKTCALILYKYMCREGNDVDESIWPIIQKVVTMGTYCKLEDDEQDLIACRLLGKHLYKKYDNYLSGKRRKEILQTSKYKRSEQNELKKKLEDICKYEEAPIEIEMVNEKNGEERQMFFSSYLAPVIAAICEYHESNPFFVKTNIWKKKINVKILSDIGENKKYCKKLSEYYAILETYCDYMEELENITKKEKFLEKYEAFCYQLIYKISDNRNPHKKEIYIQYYIVEQLIGMELFETETEIIYENISREPNIRNERDLNKHHNELRDILGKIYSYRGVITKIKLSECILKEYFEKYQKSIDSTREVARDNKKILLKKIEYEDLKFRLRENIYVEDILGDKSEVFIGKFREQLSPKDIIYGSMIEKKVEDNHAKGIEEYLERYENKAENIKRLKKEKGRGGTLRAKELEGLAKNQIAADEKRNMIKKWVICNSILQIISHKFEFD